MRKYGLLPYLSVHRPVTMIMSLIAIIVVGVVAYYQIPIELLPSGFSPPYLGVWVPYRDANPREVEEQIARPVEEQVRTIPGVKRVESYSGSNGCWIWMEFASGTNMDVAYDQLRDRMERSRAELPDDVDRYFLRKFGRNDAPIIFLAISFPQTVDDPYFIVDHHIRRPIERIDGVANIDVYGADEKVIQILVDQDRVKAYGVNLFQLINDLRNDNFSLSSGWVYEGDKKFMIRSVGRFRSIEEIKQVPINQKGLTLGDVAEIRYDVPERNWYQRINRQPAFKLEVFKESLANTVALSDQLRRLIDTQIRKDPVLKDAQINILFAQGDMIRASINNLLDTAFWGGIFAILILYYFLRRFRITLIMTVAIPVSVLIALTVTYFIGWTLNTVTMMGLMISVGMVVDNAIVVLENIYRKQNQGLGAEKAALEGASEVMLAVTMATLTTIVVFMPMILVSDDGGFFSFYLKRIGMPVIFALLGSLFVALALIPLATTRLYSPKPVAEPAAIQKLRRWYLASLQFVLKRRLDTVLVLVGIMIFTFAFLMPKTPKADMKAGGISDFRLIFTLPPNYTLEDANAFFKEVEDTIFAHAKEYNIKAVDTRFRKAHGRIQVFLNPPEHDEWYYNVYRSVGKWLGFYREKTLPRDKVLADLKQRLPEKPGVRFRTSWRSAAEGGDEGTVSVLLYGDDTGKLAELAEEVERRLRLLPGVLSVETDREAGGDEIAVHIDREVVQRNGINPREVAFTIMYALRGITLPRFQEKNKEIQMRIQLKEEDRQNLEQLKNLTFVNRDGKPVPLSAIARFSFSKGFGQIPRENGKTFLSVKATTQMEDLPRISRMIDAVMKDFDMPYGYSWQKGQRFRRFMQQNTSFLQSMQIAVVFVFILMGILFESFVLPLSVMIAIPLSLFGAYLLLYLTGTPQDIMAGIGMIVLVGVVVNNAIVLIDMINRRRQEGLSRTEAILDAGTHRLRPILMTSFTTIAGLLPMALGSATLWGFPYAPMGRAIIGGMFTSTFLTLLAVPVLYTLLDDFGAFVRRLFQWMTRRSRWAKSPSEQP